MKKKLVMTCLAALVLLAVIVWPFQVTLSLLFGWIVFLYHTLPRVTVDWPSVFVGCGALVLFTAGVHAAGRAWRRGTVEGPPWKMRWSLALVTVIFLLFAAGVSLVGMVHQAVWLLTSPEPTYVQSLRGDGSNSRNNLRQLALAMHNYHDTYDKGPPGRTFTPDGKTVAVSALPGSERTRFIRLLERTTGRELHRLEDPFAYTAALDFSPDGKTLATAGDGRNVFLWDTVSGKRRHQLEGHIGPVHALAISPDGKMLASGGGDHTIRLWDVTRGKECLSFAGHGGLVRTAAFSQDGKVVATAGHDLTLRLWDTATGEELRSIRGLSGNANAVVFSSDGKRLITASTDSVDTTIRAWDVATGKELRPLRSQHGNIAALGCTPDGRLLAAFIQDGTLRLWDAQRDTELRYPQPVKQSVKVVFSPDGKHLAVAWGVESISLWNTTTGQVLRLPVKNFGWPITLAFAPNGRLLATGHTNGLVRLWHVATGRQAHELKGHRYEISALAFAPDSKMLVSADKTGELRLWETATGRQRYHSPGHRAGVWDVSFSPDGRLLVSASSDTTALLWDMTGRGFFAPPQELSPQQLDKLWNDLTGEDAARAYRAAAQFCAMSKQSVPFLAKRLREKPEDPSRKIAECVRDLDDDSFEVREKASRALLALGDLAEPALRHALKNKPSLELRRRAETILEQLPQQPPSAHNLGALRATEILERMNTAEARRLLETLAGGAPEAFLTAEAKASLVRLARPRD